MLGRPVMGLQIVAEGLFTDRRELGLARVATHGDGIAVISRVAKGVARRPTSELFMQTVAKLSARCHGVATFGWRLDAT